MKVLRNLFYELYTSSPKDAQNDMAGWRNNLSVIVKMVRLGLTRQAGRQLWNIDPNDRSIYDFFNSMIDASVAPEFTKVENALFIKERNHLLFWKVMDQVFDIMDAAYPEYGLLTPGRLEILKGKSEEERERIVAGWKKETAYMKQLAYYTVANAGPLGVVNDGFNTIGEVLGQHYEYFTRHADLVGDAVSSKTAAYFMRALYEQEPSERKEMMADFFQSLLKDPNHVLDIIAAIKVTDEDEKAKHALDLFTERAEKVIDLPEYQALQMDQIAQDAFDFFKEGPESVHPQTSESVRNSVATVMSSKGDGSLPSDLEEVLLLAGSKPEEFNQKLLKTLGDYTNHPELRKFIQMVRRSMPVSPVDPAPN